MSMQIYKVGGCVRDRLLREQGVNAPTGDIDWVVTGATPEAMLARGFMPVGADFPVFLHPHTHEEYALARTERKTAKGYHGFTFYTAPDVTLEEDLRRRDLTINAMAEDDKGNIIDPWGGQADLKARVLRHVSEAFCEDPVRILRLARFAARFPDFTVAPETLALCRQMVASGEVDALVPERTWQELRRGLAETNPVRMIAVLEDCGVWKTAASGIEFLPTLPSPLACVRHCCALHSVNWIPLSARRFFFLNSTTRSNCANVCRRFVLTPTQSLCAKSFADYTAHLPRFAKPTTTSLFWKLPMSCAVRLGLTLSCRLTQLLSQMRISTCWDRPHEHLSKPTPEPLLDVRKAKMSHKPCGRFDWMQ